MITYRDKLLKAAKTYCKAQKVTLSTASTHAFKDGKVLDNIVNGGNITMDRYESGLFYLRSNAKRKRRARK
jgi:hypothetical protein